MNPEAVSASDGEQVQLAHRSDRATQINQLHQGVGRNPAAVIKFFLLSNEKLADLDRELQLLPSPQWRCGR